MGVGSGWYLRVAELMGHAYKMLLFANWDLHAIEKLDTMSSNATKCLPTSHKHNIFHFFIFLHLHKGVASHSVQPFPPSLLLNQPNCLKQMLNYQ